VRSTIGLARQQNYDDPSAVRAAIVESLKPLGGIEAFVREGQTVLLKPNFVKAMDPSRGGVTHPVFIAEAARLAKDAGASRVLVGDSPAFGSAKNAAKKFGLTPLLEELDVEIVEFSEVKKIKGNLENGAFKVLSQADAAHDIDVLINLPKAKAHVQMVMTGATKNLFGCIPGRKKALMHCLVKNSRYMFGRMLVENARILSPSLNIVDGVVAMEGNGPTSGQPKDWGWVLSSTDFVALDRVMSHAMGWNQDEIPHLKAAGDMKIGARTLEEIELVGGELEEMVIENWLRPQMLPISFNPIRLAIGYLKHLRQMKPAA